MLLTYFLNAFEIYYVIVIVIVIIIIIIIIGVQANVVGI
jgi:hypothetical protein